MNKKVIFAAVLIATVAACTPKPELLPVLTFPTPPQEIMVEPGKLKTIEPAAEEPRG